MDWASTDGQKTIQPLLESSIREVNGAVWKSEVPILSSIETVKENMVKQAWIGVPLRPQYLLSGWLERRQQPHQAVEATPLLNRTMIGTGMHSTTGTIFSSGDAEESKQVSSQQTLIAPMISRMMIDGRQNKKPVEKQDYLSLEPTDKFRWGCK